LQMVSNQEDNSKDSGSSNYSDKLFFLKCWRIGCVTC
jgi:hypothetical protein